MKRLALLFLALLFPLFAVAAPPFIGTDYSGVYDCKGIDGKGGKYTGTVTLKINRAQSSSGYGAYDYKLEVPGGGAYPGQAVSLGLTLAIHFAYTDPKVKDYGTALATVAWNDQGQLTIHKFYYEPEFKGGNNGVEDCVKREHATSPNQQSQKSQKIRQIMQDQLGQQDQQEQEDQNDQQDRQN